VPGDDGQAERRTKMLRSYGFDPANFPDSVTFDCVRVYPRPGESPATASNTR
jgi:hypothetical protein